MNSSSKQSQRDKEKHQTDLIRQDTARDPKIREEVFRYYGTLIAGNHPWCLLALNILNGFDLRIITIRKTSNIPWEIHGFS
jgi:hypothetical protein